jgi:hypothetical protein
MCWQCRNGTTTSITATTSRLPPSLTPMSRHCGGSDHGASSMRSMMVLGPRAGQELLRLPLPRSRESHKSEPGDHSSRPSGRADESVGRRIALAMGNGWGSLGRISTKNHQPSPTKAKPLLASFCPNHDAPGAANDPTHLVSARQGEPRKQTECKKAI